jgi:large subunit ribosomal protein L3
MTEEVNNAAEATEASSEKVAIQENSPKLNAFIGVKAGMTRIYDKEGKDVPVSVIKLIPNIVTQVKSDTKDGYSAYQVGYCTKREKLISSPIKGHIKKSGSKESVSRFFEIRVEEVETGFLGKNLDLSEFNENTFVDVTGVSKGKGFQGVMKRYGFRGGPATHGSHFHRSGGSIGNRATPGKVFKEKKMPGHMGVKKHTIQNLRVVELNLEQGYLLVRGSVPGHKNSFIKISRAKKK